jgi:hypothetical protein
LVCARRQAAPDSIAAGPHPVATTADLIASYELVLSRLWLLNQPEGVARSYRDGADLARQAHEADREEARRLLDEQAKLCDELGPDFAEAVGRRHARFWAQMMKRDPWTGEPQA